MTAGGDIRTVAEPTFILPVSERLRAKAKERQP
jgi:hypothetical protein